MFNLRSAGPLFRCLVLSTAVVSVACKTPERNAEVSRPLEGAADVASAADASTVAPPAVDAPARGAVVRGLRAEIVPVIGGLFPSSPVDPSGTPVNVPWVLRVHNTTDAPVVFRTGGDDESFEIEARGTGVGRAPVKTTCPEPFRFGKKNVIAARGSFDVPVERLVTGARCKQTAIYLTAPGLFSIDVSLIGHVHASDAPPAKGERGDQVRLDAPTITIKAS